MLLRSGRTIGVFDCMPDCFSGVAEKELQQSALVTMSDDEYSFVRSMFVFESSEILKEYVANKYPVFLNGVIYYGKFFQTIYDNIEIIKDPRFHTNGNFKKTILNKIAHWNNDISEQLLKFMLKYDDIDYPLLHSSIKSTDKIVKMVASNAYFQ